MVQRGDEEKAVGERVEGWVAVKAGTGTIEKRRGKGMASAFLMRMSSRHIGLWLCYNLVKASNIRNILVLFSQRVMLSTPPDIGLTRPYDFVIAGVKLVSVN